MNVKKFRLNVVIGYLPEAKIIMHREPVVAVLKSLAHLYKLDYNLDLDTQVFSNKVPAPQGNSDLIYFRSTDLTPVGGKELRELIKSVFSHLNFFDQGVSVFFQFQKDLKNFPFPKDYIRPLNYPYFEDSQGVLKLSAEFLETNFPEEPFFDIPFLN